jgi:hypothetical protein
MPTFEFDLSIITHHELKADVLQPIIARRQIAWKGTYMQLWAKEREAFFPSILASCDWSRIKVRSKFVALMASSPKLETAYKSSKKPACFKDASYVGYLIVEQLLGRVS